MKLGPGFGRMALVSLSFLFAIDARWRTLPLVSMKEMVSDEQCVSRDSV
jgi:hypothetical protein